MRRDSVMRLAVALIAVLPSRSLTAQGPGGLPDSVKARRWALENELESLAVVDRKVMIPMRDGVRIAADIYRPKDVGKKYPAIWVRTPYNFNFWDVQNGVPRDMTAALTAMKRGYAYIDMQERGHFFSEGNYDILGPPLTDGDDELNWICARSHGRTARSARPAARRPPSGRARWRRSAIRDTRRSTCRDSAPASAASARTTSRATGIAAAPCRCCSSIGCTASRIRCGR